MLSPSTIFNGLRYFSSSSFNILLLFYFGVLFLVGLFISFALCLKFKLCLTWMSSIAHQLCLPMLVLKTAPPSLSYNKVITLKRKEYLRYECFVSPAIQIDVGDRVITLCQEVSQVIDIELYNIWGGWALDFGHTRGFQYEYLYTLETYRQMRQLFGPMIAEHDTKIKEFQVAQLETNKRIAILHDKDQKFDLYFKLIYTHLNQWEVEPQVTRCNRRGMDHHLIPLSFIWIRNHRRQLNHKKVFVEFFCYYRLSLSSLNYSFLIVANVNIQQKSGNSKDII